MYGGDIKFYSDQTSSSTFVKG
ncbi:hypothetical protein Gohar_027184 [Gossypium harknessii]|uniref:Uncharacterized protein n=1 Tax=Gossypium harknessii TaxID=34285 RepID=A0A7J9HUG8_9ROSI|nr:hypothetical protein [Gossypium harknessii]